MATRIGVPSKQARLLVGKVMAYEASSARLSGRAVVVADNSDEAGDFETHADEIAQSFPDPRKIYLSRLGIEGTRSATIEAFNEARRS